MESARGEGAGGSGKIEKNRRRTPRKFLSSQLITINRFEM